MVRSFILAVLCLVSAPSMAQTTPSQTLDVTEQNRLDRALRGIDVVPSRMELDAAFEDPAAMLRGAAAQADRNLYERRRAISLLSAYPSPETQAFLAGLAADPEPEIRGFAAYTAARTFGAAPDAALIATLEIALQDSSPDVKKWALRGLRWVAAPRAEALLRHYASHASGDLKKVATTALRKRLK